MISTSSLYSKMTHLRTYPDGTATRHLTSTKHVPCSLWDAVTDPSSYSDYIPRSISLALSYAMLLIFLPAMVLGFFLSVLGSTCSSRCKSIPGSAGWPAAGSWAALNGSIQGRLVSVEAPAAACHADQSTYNNATCAAIQAGWSTYDFHAQNPVSSDWQNQNNDSCLPYSNSSCTGKGYPIYVINASSSADVQAGVRFGEAFDSP